MIYLDHNATSIIRPSVKQKVISLLQDELPPFSNPSSIHQMGVNAKRLMEQSRQSVADFFNNQKIM